MPKFRIDPNKGPVVEPGSGFESGDTATWQTGSFAYMSGVLTYSSGSYAYHDSGSIDTYNSGSTQTVSGAFTLASGSLLTLATGSSVVADLLNREGSFLLRGTMATSASIKISGSVQINASTAAAQAASGSVFMQAAGINSQGGPYLGLGINPQNIGTWGQARIVLSGSDEAASKRQIAIMMFSTGTTAAPTNFPGIDTNPPAGAIFFFTDGSDLYIKLAAGTVKKVTAV